MRFSPDGSYIACGDWHGNIRIHDLNTPQIDEVKCIEAHENEILSLDFAKKDQLANHVNDSGHLLVSASRDTLIQIYDSETGYDPI